MALDDETLKELSEATWDHFGFHKTGEEIASWLVRSGDYFEKYFSNFLQSFFSLEFNFLFFSFFFPHSIKGYCRYKYIPIFLEVAVHLSMEKKQTLSKTSNQYKQTNKPN